VVADYQKIREENIVRYGWDTAVLDLLGQLYSERTHFIFELIQNAEDAGATELAFELFEDRLELRHDGRPFTEDDVRGICAVGKSRKAGELTQIGKFGIGFKSVYAYTKSPRVYSGAESFGIENYVRPYAVEPAPVPDTLFVFPFDHDEVPAGLAVQEISAALSALEPVTLLFLRHIERLTAGPAVIERRTGPGPGTSRHVRLSSGRGAQEWLVWQRQRVEIAFRQHQGQIVPCATSPLTVFLPTQKETFLGFLIQGPYRTTPARDNIGERDPANQELARATAALLPDVLLELRAAGLLTAEVLAALPLDAIRFQPGSIFRPLFDAARDTLAAQELIPVAGGGHRAARAVRLADGTGLPGLLSPGQLGALYGAAHPLFFAGQDLTPPVRRYLREEIGVEELTAADFIALAGADFLRAQPDEWIAGFYAFLHADRALSRAAVTGPIIRLEDGSQVEPFDSADRPAVYLPRPGPHRAGFPTVRRAIADSPAARRFLDVLGLATPDLTDEVLHVVLPGYDRLDVASLEAARHDADLDLVLRALDEAPAGKRQELLDRLGRTPFLAGENAATGERRLLPPTELYQRSKELEIYFDQNPRAWFAGDGYGPWLVQLRAMGVRDAVEVRARPPGPLGHVILADEFARHERGLDGFDPQAEIDGLDFALRHPSHARSEFVWNRLLAPHRRLVAGVVEKSVRDEFVDSRRERAVSAIAAAAGREPWLPGPDGTFRRPSELSLDDLPPVFSRDEALAKALGMAQPAVAEAARQLGIPPQVLWGLSARPDLIALVTRELESRPDQGA